MFNDSPYFKMLTEAGISIDTVKADLKQLEAANKANRAGSGRGSVLKGQKKIS